VQEAVGLELGDCRDGVERRPAQPEWHRYQHDHPSYLQSTTASASRYRGLRHWLI